MTGTMASSGEASTDSDPRAAPRPPDRPRRTARWTALAVGLVVTVLVAVLATRPNASDVQAPSPLLGLPAPEIQGPGLDGATVRLSDLRGRWVLVNFFATWCVPCVREHPELVRFADRQPAEEAQILGVVYDDDPAEVRSFIATRGGSWPVVDDSGAKVDFGVRGVPESFLVSPGGIVVSHLVGGVTADGLTRLVAQARAGSG